MPTQFEYPETGWSTGNMRMAKAGARDMDPSRGYRELEGERKKRETRASDATPAMKALGPEEWQKFWSGNWSVHGEASTVDPSKADPGGFVIKQGHPQIKELEKNGWESFGIPDETWGKGWQFMRPPQDDKTPVAQMGRVA